MTNEEISKFATQPTYYGVTIVFKITKSPIVGFFSNNIKHSDKSSKEFESNIWNFTQTPENIEIEINGDEIASITIN